MANSINVPGVNEKQLKTILESNTPLCNGKKGNLRDLGRAVYAQVFASAVVDPKRTQVLQALGCARDCELTLDGNVVANKSIKISTYKAVKESKIDVESAIWDDSSKTLKLEAVTL